MAWYSRFRCGLVGLMCLGLLSACASTPQEDPYVLYRDLMPRSILVLPPINESVDVNAPYSWVTTVSKPIAEQGYYVFPVGIVDEFMKSNGLPEPADMHRAPIDKLGKVFGADAVLYVTLEEFGQKFEVLSSATRVDARAELVDVRTAQVIWNGDINFAERNNNSGDGLVGALVSAAITQVVRSKTDASHDAAIAANERWFQNSRDGLLIGPLHPSYEASQ